MERVRRLAGHGLPTEDTLTGPLGPDQVRAWARYAETSPLYSHLAEVIAGDDRLLQTLNRIEHTPEPNVLFAGVQYLMARLGGGDLERHYPNFAGNDARIEGVDRPFRQFVLSHEDDLVEIGRTRYTQTNECRRCVALLPAIWATPLDRFHLLDVGTSAGLNLLLDRYHYRWDGVEWGPESSVRLETHSCGAAPVPRSIEVLSRHGIDLHPVDPSDPDDRVWLEALVWPEHHDRRRRLRAALDLAAEADIDLIAGDALEVLAPTLDRLPPGEPAVVMHSFALNQFDGPSRERFDRILDECRAVRPLYRVSMEALDPDDAAAVVAVDGGAALQRIARAQPHGEWLELYARP